MEEKRAAPVPVRAEINDFYAVIGSLYFANAMLQRRISELETLVETLNARASTTEPPKP